jgi:hypothetical protein
MPSQRRKRSNALVLSAAALLAWGVAAGSENAQTPAVGKQSGPFGLGPAIAFYGEFRQDVP